MADLQIRHLATHDEFLKTEKHTVEIPTDDKKDYPLVLRPTTCPYLLACQFNGLLARAPRCGCQRLEEALASVLKHQPPSD